MTDSPSKRFDTVLIANRGAIATRIIRTLRRMGLRSVAVYSEADEGSLHVSEADEAVCIGPARESESYLNVEAILAAAKATGAGAIHPGYGFLAENTDFAEACAAAGIVFIGPTPDNIRTFGLKHSARALAAASRRFLAAPRRRAHRRGVSHRHPPRRAPRRARRLVRAAPLSRRA
jgi:urea carboxylase